MERKEQHEQSARLPRSYDTAIPWREKFYFAALLRNSLHKTVGDIRAGAATWNEAIHIKNTQQRQNWWTSGSCNYYYKSSRPADASLLAPLCNLYCLLACDVL